MKIQAEETAALLVAQIPTRPSLDNLCILTLNTSIQ
jgi:hypothetical protein